MAKIYLVRHGQAASGWGLEEDPGLDDLGRSQARDAAQKLAPLGPLPILSSPKARARETASPLAAEIIARFAETVQSQVDIINRVQGR